MLFLQASGVTAVANTATQQLAAMQQAAKTMGLGALGVAPGINTGGLIGGVNPMQLAGAMAAMNSASLINSLASQPRALLSQAGRGRGGFVVLCCIVVLLGNNNSALMRCTLFFIEPEFQGMHKNLLLLCK